MSMKTEYLTIPDDEELKSLLGADVFARETVHEWQLSRVEKITAGRDVFILKTQLAAASVERAFFESVDHPLLCRPIAAFSCGDCDALLFPFLTGEQDDWASMTDEGIRCRVRELTEPFFSLEAPHYFDYSSPAALNIAFASVRNVLKDAGMGEDELEALGSALRENCGAFFEEPVGLLHGDLTEGNVLGGILIDWQRPILGPRPLDEELALLLSRRTVAGVFGGLAHFALCHWFMHAYAHFLRVPFVCAMAVRFARESLKILPKGV